MKTSWTTKLYEYRVRIEHDSDVDPPWDWEGQLGDVTDSAYSWNKGVSSGWHNVEERHTLFWEEIGYYNGRHYVVSITLTEALKKYYEFMGKEHPGRWPLVQWIKKNLEIEADVARWYLDGECYGFQVFRRPVDETGYSPEEDDETGWKFIDSCWGFIGPDNDKNGMSGYIDPEAYEKVDLEAWEAQAYAPNL